EGRPGLAGQRLLQPPRGPAPPAAPGAGTRLDRPRRRRWPLRAQDRKGHRAVPERKAVDVRRPRGSPRSLNGLFPVEGVKRAEASPGSAPERPWEDARMMQEPSADVHPLDEHRDPSDTAFVRGLAAEVAARHGGEVTRMRRANGYSNATWVGDGIAVRIAHAPVGMAREVALARALPREVGHPEILGEGTAEGHGWIVTAEIRGQNLHEAWPTLTPAEQRRAVRQLWARARIVHEASPALRPHGASPGVSWRPRPPLPRRRPGAP